MLIKWRVSTRCVRPLSHRLYLTFWSFGIQHLLCYWDSDVLDAAYKLHTPHLRDNTDTSTRQNINFPGLGSVPNFTTSVSDDSHSISHVEHPPLFYLKTYVSLVMTSYALRRVMQVVYHRYVLNNLVPPETKHHFCCLQAKAACK